MSPELDFLKTAVEVAGTASAAAVAVGAYLKRQVTNLIRQEIRPIAKRLKRSENNHRVLAQGLFLNLHRNGNCEDDDCPCYKLERLAKEEYEEEDDD